MFFVRSTLPLFSLVSLSVFIGCYICLMHLGSNLFITFIHYISTKVENFSIDYLIFCLGNLSEMLVL